MNATKDSIDVPAGNFVQLRISVSGFEQDSPFDIAPCLTPYNAIGINAFTDLPKPLLSSSLEIDGTIRIPVELTADSNSNLVVIDLDSRHLSCFWDELFQSLERRFDQWKPSKRTLRDRIEYSPDVVTLFEQFAKIADKAARKRLMKDMFAKVVISEHLEVVTIQGRNYASLSIRSEKLTTVRAVFQGSKYKLAGAKFLRVATHSLSRAAGVLNKLATPLMIIVPLAFNIFEEYRDNEFLFLRYIGLSLLDIAVSLAAYKVGAYATTTLAATTLSGAWIIIGGVVVAIVAGELLENLTSSLREDIRSGLPDISWIESWEQIKWCMQHQAKCIRFVVDQHRY